MTVESFLTREFDIRFIDARNIVNEAKVKLGIYGYPTKEQQVQLVKESYYIYKERSDKDELKKLNDDLESLKFDPTNSSITVLSSSSLPSIINNYLETDGNSSYCGDDPSSNSSVASSSVVSGTRKKKKSLFDFGRRYK